MQRAASLSQRKQEALRCSIPIFLMLSTTTKSAAILMEGVFCSNFLFSCEVRCEESCLPGWFFQAAPGWKL